MNFSDFLTLCSGSGDLAELKKALTEGKTCAWRRRKGTLEYAIQDAFHPVFALLATGRGADRPITGNQARSAWTMESRGIEDHLVSIRQRTTSDYTVGDATSLPAGGGCVRISVDSGGLRGALERAFSVPGSPGPVMDIRVERPTGTNLEGTKDYATTAGTRTVPRLYMAAAYVVLGNHNKIPQGSRKEREGVVGVVTDRKGKIVSWGLKNQDVDCWHGETISVLRLGGKLPEGATVFSTLKPCHMCSGVLHAASGGTVKVYWGMDDPRVSERTCLENDRLGVTLDGNRSADHRAKALLIKTSPTNGKEAVSEVLKKDFATSRMGSAIDFSATHSTATARFGSVQTAFTEKLTNYIEGEKAGHDKNPNTLAVLKYLDDFLRSHARVM